MSDSWSRNKGREAAGTYSFGEGLNMQGHETDSNTMLATRSEPPSFPVSDSSFPALDQRANLSCINSSEGTTGRPIGLCRKDYDLCKETLQNTDLIDQEQTSEANITDFIDATNHNAQRLTGNLQNLAQAIDDPFSNIDETKPRQDRRIEIAERLPRADERLVQRCVSLNETRADLLRLHMEPNGKSKAAHNSDDRQRLLSSAQCDAMRSPSAAPGTSPPSSLESLETHLHLLADTIASPLLAIEEQVLNQRSQSSSPSRPVSCVCSGCKASFNSVEDLKIHFLHCVRPYHCSFPNCKDPPQSFNFTDWQKHDIVGHRTKFKWTCNICSLDFEERSLEAQHLVEKHGMAMNSDAMEDILERSRSSLLKEGHCGFCQDASLESLEDYTAHVEQHLLEDIASLVIATHLPPSYLRKDPFDGSQTSDDSRDNPFNPDLIVWNPSLQQFLPYSALYDSGTRTHNFITKKAVRQLRYTLKPLQQKYCVNLLDGLTTEVSHFITPYWRVNGNSTMFNDEHFLVVDEIQNGEVDVLLSQKVLLKQRKAGNFIFVVQINKQSRDQTSKLTEAHVRQLHDGKAAREERKALSKAQTTNGTTITKNGTQKPECRDCKIHEADHKLSNGR